MNNKFVLSLFFLVALLISIIFIDIFILPKTTINDTVVETKELLERIGDSDKYKVVGYKCKTSKGYVFHIQSIGFLAKQKNEVKLKLTLLLKNVIGLKSKNKDYSDILYSNTVYELKYFYLFVLGSLIINIIIIYFNLFIKRNSLWNFIGFNFLLILFWLIIEYSLKLQSPLFKF
ncbi:hypothetical protein JBL43_02885 [Aureibaculum sp. A20]|uniref:Uncharacterized protein n=1 Tax=Aureibaculum flavum TaxID=2795986 RepID=A0ABS0WMI0_9FLAO|nr:hypothetical protein [Aureibaculum flavum]MBJ2173168.1 hypothetical protein [Aureibaculum flavum]